MTHQPSRAVFRLCAAVLVVGAHANVSATFALAQELKYEDRVGSNKDFDLCEDFRFRRITKLVKDGKISQQQGYNVWKRIRSDKEAVRKIFDQAIKAGELTRDQANRLLPLIDAKMSYIETRHGRFGQPKLLQKGQFKAGEVTAKNRAAVHRRLIAANERGQMYDYDVASIMKQLYAGFDEATAPADKVAAYRAVLNPRIGQSGSMSRVLQSVQMQRSADKQKRKGYGSREIKIAEPAEWIRNLEKPIYSGPQPGEKVVALKAVSLRGNDAGREYDPVALAGDKLHLLLFVNKSRTFGRFLGQLKNQLQAIETNSKHSWAMSIVVCTDDANAAQKTFAVLDGRYPKNLFVGLSKDGSSGPPAYGLDRNLTATVIVVRNGRVAYNLPYAGDAFYSQPHILGAIAGAMGVDHDTLRRYIGDTPGDAAMSAYARNMQRNQEGTNAPQRGFPKKLAPLVLANKLTRAEAGELFRASGDKKALRARVEALVKAEKLTREEAQELLKQDGKFSPARDERNDEPREVLNQGRAVGHCSNLRQV